MLKQKRDAEYFFKFNINFYHNYNISQSTQSKKTINMLNNSLLPICIFIFQSWKVLSM